MATFTWNKNFKSALFFAGIDTQKVSDTVLASLVELGEVEDSRKETTKFALKDAKKSKDGKETAAKFISKDSTQVRFEGSVSVPRIIAGYCQTLNELERWAVNADGAYYPIPPVILAWCKANCAKEVVPTTPKTPKTP